MKQRWKRGIFLCVLTLSVVFCGLWLYEKNDRAEMEQLCQAAAASSRDAFQEYRDHGNEDAYWRAVADFRTFEQAYFALEPDGAASAEYIFCNTVYGALVGSSEDAKKNLDELIVVMTTVAADIYDPNGYIQMADLSYKF